MRNCDCLPIGSKERWREVMTAELAVFLLTNITVVVTVLAVIKGGF